MKPLLMLAPSPTRWPAVQDLLAHESAAWLEDTRKRVVEGVDHSQDALAVIPDGGNLLASAVIRRRREVGVLGQVFTHPAQRKRGCARALLQALLSWFDMTEGKWLYLTGPRELAGGLFEKFGFKVLHAMATPEPPRVTMLRVLGRGGESPFDGISGPVKIRDVARADWVLLVALLQHHCGADPRVCLEESGMTAETTALELIEQQERGACRLIAASRHDRIVGVGSVATGQGGPRTYAMILPHDQPPEGLRNAVLEFARKRGFTQVDFPMEALAPKPAPADAADAPSSPHPDSAHRGER